MGKIIENKILQIFIAILIPNLCAWIAFAILANKIAENESRDQIEPGYAPPGYVRIYFSMITLITFLHFFQGRWNCLDYNFHNHWLWELEGFQYWKK